jgi:hypothetical protein
VGGRRGRPAYRSIVLGILVAVVGVASLIVGVFLQAPIIGILGFVIMLTGVLLAIAPPRRRAGSPEEAAEAEAPPTKGRATQPGFMDRLNDRWDKRQDGSS